MNIKVHTGRLWPDRLKIDRSTIANLLRLLELPLDRSKRSWLPAKITNGHARAILPLGDESEQIAFSRNESRRRG